MMERGCVEDQPQQRGHEWGKYPCVFPSEVLRRVEDDTAVSPSVST